MWQASREMEQGENDLPRIMCNWQKGKVSTLPLIQLHGSRSHVSRGIRGAQSSCYAQPQRLKPFSVHIATICIASCFVGPNGGGQRIMTVGVVLPHM